MPRQGLNPRQAETVERLLVAGIEELRAVGHDALTVRTVAQRAGVSPATAYTYLASKNHLFAELFWRHLASGRTSEPEGETPLARLQSTMRLLTARIVEEPELAAALEDPYEPFFESDAPFDKARTNRALAGARQALETTLAARGKDVLFAVLLATVMLPSAVTLLPTFLLFSQLGWVGSYLPLVVPHFFANAYNVFLLRQYFLTIPRELDEAAMIDGAGPFRILRSVIIPQAMRIIIPPLTSQYLNLTKNSSLAIAIGFPDLVAVGGTILNQTGQAVEVVGLVGQHDVEGPPEQPLA